jgi:3-hydroxyacyl-CoA dehydrogenase/enoyl-CoA hydratase/3-hydroxybutyryl-CoA epimerase
VGWLVIEDPATSTNILSDAVRASIASAVETLLQQGVRALVVSSGKEDVFSVGADLNVVQRLRDPRTAMAFSRDGQMLFHRLSQLPIPVIGAIHGRCLGGGFELALACHWRVVTDSPRTQIGLPEIGVGVIPGWGGCVRLSRLIGPKAALVHILSARTVSASEAVKAGLADECVTPGELKDRARAAALRLAERGASRPRQNFEEPSASYFSERINATRKRTRGLEPAPLAVIDVIQRTVSLPTEEALPIEADAFGKVASGPVARNMIYAFFLRHAASRRTLEKWYPPSPTALPSIRRVGVVGAGVMGSGIAQWAAACGFDVVMRDADDASLQHGLHVIRNIFTEAEKRGVVSSSEVEDSLGRIKATTEWEGFENCDLIIEAISEDRAAKQRLFAELAAVTRPGTLLASNSSALPIEETASGVPGANRTLGIHFFNPVRRMALVELIVGKNTSAETAGRALAFVKALKKSPVICRSSPGFLMTRVLFFYLNEAVRLCEQGVPPHDIETAMLDFGWPMGPLRLLDEVGLDVANSIFAELAAAFPQTFVSSKTCDALVAAGRKGRKNGMGAGFYIYIEGKESLNTIAFPSAAAAGATSPGLPAISERLMRVLVQEAGRCLAEGVVQSDEDIDFAFNAGAGFPRSRGGLMRYAQETDPTWLQRR